MIAPREERDWSRYTAPQWPPGEQRVHASPTIASLNGRHPMESFRSLASFLTPGAGIVVTALSAHRSGRGLLGPSAFTRTQNAHSALACVHAPNAAHGDRGPSARLTNSVIRDFLRNSAAGCSAS